MAGYVKLFGSILDSSIWREPPLTRLVWLTLLAMADRDGVVEASLEGIADRAKVDARATEKALACFMAPDPKSKNPANEGRRLKRITDGYQLLNYDFYRQKLSADEMRAKAAERQRRYRERQQSSVTSDVTSRRVTPVDRSNGSDQAQAQAQAQITSEASEKRSAAPGGPDATAVLVFPCAGEPKTWDLTSGQIATWTLLFQGVGVETEARAALAWIAASPERKKTARGMARFLVGWLGRAQNRGPTNGHVKPAPESFRARDERERREAAERERKRREAERISSAEAKRIIAELEAKS